MRDNNRPYQRNTYRNNIDILGDEIPTMYKAICDNCRKNCEIPFRPSNGKPVYCKDCFTSMREGSSATRKSDRESFDRPSFDSKQMFKVTCDECGRICEVPFKPSNNKPVYCNECFGKKGNNSRSSQSNDNESLEEQLEVINTKLDKIVQFLTLNKK